MKIYRDNPNLKDKSSDEQMEFIRWRAALSITVNRMDFLKNKGCSVCNFNIGLSEVAIKWAEENQFETTGKNKILKIGLEKIKRFNPDIIYLSLIHI